MASSVRKEEESMSEAAGAEQRLTSTGPLLAGELLCDANREYNNLINLLKEGTNSANALFDECSELSSNYRGLLLGRESGVGATYSELRIARLQHDVPFSVVNFDMIDGSLQTQMQEIKLTPNAMVEALCESLEVLLKGWPKEKREQFVRSGKINKSVVNALFNIGKRKNLRVSDVAIDYATRCKLVDLCLDVSNGYQINKGTAAWAYMRLVGDPTGKNRKIVDMKKATHEFGNQLSTLMAAGYLDIQAGYSVKETTDNESETEDNKPKVRTIVVAPKSKDRMFHVWVIDNPISPPFINYLLEEMNSLLFTRGKGGKKQAYQRNASSTDDPAPIVIAGRFIYGGLPLSIIETKLIELANLICRFQRKMIEEHHGHDYVVTFHCNLIHTVVAAIADALYGAHSDFSNLLCSDSNNGKRCHVDGDHWLPTRDEMQIGTFVLSNSPNLCSTELIYTDSSDGTGVLRTVGKVRLGSCCFHIQGPGSQSPGFKHEVKTFGSNDGSIFRVAFTMRHTIDPKKSPEELKIRLGQDLSGTDIPPYSSDYRHKNVFQSCVNYEAGDSSVTEESSSHVSLTGGHAQSVKQEYPSSKDLVPAISLFAGANAKPANVKPAVNKEDACCTQLVPISSANVKLLAVVKEDYTTCQEEIVPSSLVTDLYPRIPDSIYDSMCFEQSCPKMKLGGTIAKELAAAKSLKLMYDTGYLLSLQPTTCRAKAIPCIHLVRGNDINSPSNLSFPVPGKRYHRSNISADAGLKHTDRSHPIYCADEATHPVMILSQPYKNDAVSIRNLLQRLDCWTKELQHEDGSELYNSTCSGDIRVFGSGGSPEIMGSFAPSPNTASKHDPQIILPMHQSMENPTNLMLLQMELESKVVSIYVNECIFNSVEGAATRKQPRHLLHQNDSTYVRFLGVYQCSKITIKSIPEDDVVAEHKGDSPSLQIYARYKMVPHLSAKFTPFFSNADITKQVRSNYSISEFKTAVIPHDCPDPINYDLPFGDGILASSLNPAKLVLRSTILKAFLTNGSLNKYVLSPSRAEDSDLHDDAGRIEMGDTDSAVLDEEMLSDEVESISGEDEVGSIIGEEDASTFACASFNDLKEAVTSSKRKVPLLKKTEGLKSPPPKRSKAEKGISVTIVELIDAAVLNSYCGALRFKELECLMFIGGKMCGTPIKDTNLPIVFRKHPLPMSNRALDVITLGYRRDALNGGLFERCRTSRKERIKYKEAYKVDLCDCVFKALLLRFTGRLGPIYCYSLQHNKKTGCMIPSTNDELSGFLEFMKCTLDQNKTKETLGQWVSDQHKKSIPSSTKEYNGFAAFITEAKKRLPLTLDQILEKNATNLVGSRADSVAELKRMLLTCCNGDVTGHLHFLAQQILADVEELFEDPFGPVVPKGLVAGQGGMNGYAMVKNCGGRKKHQLEETLRDVVLYMCTQTKEWELNIAGYYIDGETKLVSNMVNGRPFSATDAEHFLCKGWMIAKLTLPHYCNSRYPNATKPHCHPAKLPLKGEHPFPFVNDIMDGIIKIYESHRSLMKPPEFCYLSGEHRASSVEHLASSIEHRASV